MARPNRNGNGRLERELEELAQAIKSREQAHAALVQAQATLVANQAATNQAQTAILARMAETDAQIAQTNRRMDETDRINSDRFARIEAILMEHSRILLGLPDAIREKIGFRSPEPPPKG